MKLALETDSLDAIADRIRTLIKPETPTTLLDKLKLLPKLAEVGNFFPKVIPAKDAPCKQVIHRSAEDGGRGIRPAASSPSSPPGPRTAARSSRCPASSPATPAVQNHGKRNVGMYRMQVYDGQTTGMHWQRQKNAAEHLRDHLRMATNSGAPYLAHSQMWDRSASVDIMAQTSGGIAPASDPASIPATTLAKVREGRMEVAVAIGTDPATTFSAIVPAPPEVEEYLIAGFLRGKPVELVKARDGRPRSPRPR